MKIKPFEEGYIIKSSKGIFTVKYAGCIDLGGIYITDCQKCAIHKMSTEAKMNSCKPILNILFDIPIDSGCLLKSGYVFKKLKGGI